MSYEGLTAFLRKCTGEKKSSSKSKYMSENYTDQMWSFLNCRPDRLNFLHPLLLYDEVLIRKFSFPHTDSIFVFGAEAPPPRGPGPPHSRGFYITHNDAPQSVGLLWTSDQLVTETSNWQNTTLKTDKHPCSRLGSNPQSQQASSCRPTP